MMHGRDFCECGAVLAQCRCYDCDGKDRVVATRCAACRSPNKVDDSENVMSFDRPGADDEPEETR